MKLEEQNSSNASKRIAAVITEVLSPPWLGVAVLGAISFASTTSWEEFLTWWLLAASAIILAPLAFVLWGVRTGKFSDRYVMKRE